MADEHRTKRQREAKPDKNDFLFKARIIMRNDPFKECAPKEEEKMFRALFGCSVQVAFKLWNLLQTSRLMPEGGTMTHLLWMCLFIKVYPTEATMKKLTDGADNKTIRKWVFSFIRSVALLEPVLVSFYFTLSKYNWFAKSLQLLSLIISNLFCYGHTYVQIKWRDRKKGDIGNDCLVSVDGTDFRIRHAGRKFYSFKYNASGLRYEIAVCILSGECVWINGPFEPGIYNDITIFRNAIMHELEEGERVEADDG